MDRQFFRQTLGWGFLLWFTGYILGFVFFIFVPYNLIGWVIMPIGILLTLWVLRRKIKGSNLQYYFHVGIWWTIIAIICDYLFLVLLINPTDGYYKPDVYVYYILTLLLPVAVGWWKLQQSLPPMFDKRR